eukprot:403367568
MKQVNFENVLISDPLRIKRYDTPNYKRVYLICVLIPFFLAFSLVFFLIFFMSPHGRNMRHYQREIFEWNKDQIANQMDQLTFALKINPFINSNWSRSQMIIMEHHDKPSQFLEERQLYNLLTYQQSYFWFNNTEGIFPKLDLKNITQIPVGQSEDYCAELWWRPLSREKSYISDFTSEQDNYRYIEDLPQCLNSKNKTQYHWGYAPSSINSGSLNQSGASHNNTGTDIGVTSTSQPHQNVNDTMNSGELGLSFKAWRETEIELWCTNFTCDFTCKSLHGGIYKNGTCYKYEVLKRLCVMIDIEDVNSKTGKASQIEYQGGCFGDDEIGYYELATPNKTHYLDYVPFEVRHKEDPYIIYAQTHYNLGRDLTIFFWLSIACFSSALIMTLVMTISVLTIRQKDTNQRRAYVREDLN